MSSEASVASKDYLKVSEIAGLKSHLKEGMFDFCNQPLDVIFRPLALITFIDLIPVAFR
jgi:hypothetical protein